jgi:hypothetical protein
MSYLHGSALVTAARKMKGKRAYSSMCQAFSILTSKTGTSTPDFDGDGDHDAVDWWKHAVKHGQVVLAKDIKKLSDVPAGTLAYWTGGSHGYGHAAPTTPGGNVVSTDAPVWGTIGEVPIDWIAKHWGNGLKFVGYIVNDGYGHQMVDAGAPAAKPATKPPAPKVPVPNVRPVDVCSHTEWNLGGLDIVGEGAKTFAARIDEICAEMANIGSDVFSLLEIRTEHLDKLERALDKIGYKVAVYGKGRAVVVKKGLRVGRTAVYLLPTVGPANDTRYVVFAEVFIGEHAWLFSAGHFEHRNGAAYDRVRVQQAKEAFAKGERLRKNWGINKTRVSYADDENSDRQVLEQAYEPNGYYDVFDGAWQPDNEATATYNGWSDQPHAGERIDKIKAHKSRPRRRAHVRKAAAGIADHIPTTVVYGTTTK